jgi:hypothetical protein
VASTTLMGDTLRVARLQLLKNPKRISSFFLLSTESVPLHDDTSVSRFFRSETIIFADISDPCLLFKFFT